MLMTKEQNLVTLINVFETSLEQQQALIEHGMRFVDSVIGSSTANTWRPMSRTPCVSTPISTKGSICIVMRVLDQPGE